MGIQADIALRQVWRRREGGLKCSAITDENHLLLCPRHRGVKQGPVEQSALYDRDHHTAELRALSFMGGGDSVGESQVLEAQKSGNFEAAYDLLSTADRAFRSKNEYRVDQEKGFGISGALAQAMTY